MEENVVGIQEIFKFQKETINSAGKVIGHFRSSGIRPRVSTKITEVGIILPDDIFDSSQLYE